MLVYIQTSWVPALRALCLAYNTYLSTSFTKIIVRLTWTSTIVSSNILSCCSYCLPTALGQSHWPAVRATAWQRDSLPMPQWSSYSHVGHWVTEHLWLSLLASVMSGPTQPLLLRCLSGRPIFLNFVTFSTKHESTSDKAYSRLLGSCYVHANAHRRPWSRLWVFATETSSVLDYI